MPTPHKISHAASNRQLQLRKYESSLRQKDYYEWLQICHEMITVNVNKIMVLPLLLLARCSHKACGLENRRSISLCPVQIWRFFMHMRWCEEATIYVQSLNQIVKNSNPHFFFAFTRICSCIIMQLFSLHPSSWRSWLFFQHIAFYEKLHAKQTYSFYFCIQNLFWEAKKYCNRS